MEKEHSDIAVTHSISQLREMLSYDPLTGMIVWRIQKGSRASPGKLAGHITSVKGKQYRYITIDGVYYTAGQIAWAMSTGQFPLGSVLFRNNDTLDLRFSNLKEAEYVEYENKERDMSTRSGRIGYVKPKHSVERNRVYNLKKNFGLTVADYQKKFVAQNGVCAICERQEVSKRNGEVKWLAVDHDHETGVVRDLLCTACNNALGQLQDDANLLRKAADYIEHHRTDRDNVVPLRKENTT